MFTWDYVFNNLKDFFIFCCQEKGLGITKYNFLNFLNHMTYGNTWVLVLDQESPREQIPGPIPDLLNQKSLEHGI